MVLQAMLMMFFLTEGSGNTINSTSTGYMESKIGVALHVFQQEGSSTEVSLMDV